MAQIGTINKLTIKKIAVSGVYLDGGESGDVFLPKRHVHVNDQPGDEVEVFVYEDREKRLLATTQKPYVTVGQFAALRVVANSPSGAYMDWGMQKDLLVPKKEQHTKMEEGKKYIVYVFLDEKTNRVAASSKLDKFLDKQPSNYSEGAEVDLLVCEKTDLGYKAIVNNAHWGMLYKNEVFQNLFIGQSLNGYIKKIRLDQKIDLVLQPPGYEKVEGVSEDILKKIKDFGGKIEVTDKSPPDVIYSLFGVSKKVFKKAVGGLYKKRLIMIDENYIQLGSKSNRKK